MVVGRCVSPQKEDSGETVRIPLNTGETLRVVEQPPPEQKSDDSRPETGGKAEDE